jgi:hypothetical protein
MNSTKTWDFSHRITVPFIKIPVEGLDSDHADLATAIPLPVNSTETDGKPGSMKTNQPGLHDGDPEDPEGLVHRKKARLGS